MCLKYIIYIVEANIDVLDTIGRAKQEGLINTVGFSYRSTRHWLGIMLRLCRSCCDWLSYQVIINKLKVITYSKYV